MHVEKGRGNCKRNVEIPLESGIEQKRVEIIRERRAKSQSEDWKEVRFKIECYLRAWRLPDEALTQERVSSILEAVQSRVIAESGINPTLITIEQTDHLIRSCFQEFLGDAIE